MFPWNRHVITKMSPTFYGGCGSQSFQMIKVQSNITVWTWHIYRPWTVLSTSKQFDYYKLRCYNLNILMFQHACCWWYIFYTYTFHWFDPHCVIDNGNHVYHIRFTTTNMLSTCSVLIKFINDVVTTYVMCLVFLRLFSKLFNNDILNKIL